MDTPTLDNNKVLIASIALRGHAMPLIRLAKELVQRGYTVHFATHSRGREWVESSVPGAKFISLGKFPLTLPDLQSLIKRVSQDTSNFHGIRALFNELYLPNTQSVYHALMPAIESLSPSVIVSDIAALGALDAAAQSNTPLVVNNPTLPFSLKSPPPWLPAWGTGLSLSMSLWEKCMNTVFPRLLSIALTPPFITLNKQRWSIDLPTFRSQHDIFSEARILENTAFGFDHARAMPPLSQMVGVIMPPELTGRNAQMVPLSPLIRNWLHGGGNNRQFQGVVLVSIGRMAQMEAWQAREITEGLTDPRFRVLWVLPNEGQARSVIPNNLPPSFRIKSMGSVPRLKVLADPAVRAVIMHCGLGSVQEALYFGKPVLCIPYLADQSDVGARLEDSGAGRRLSKFGFVADEVKSHVLDLFGTVEPIQSQAQRRRFATNLDPGNSSYAVAARRVGQFLRLAGGVHKAADVVEATISAGSAHLRTYSLEQPWHKVLQADVYAVYVAVVCLMAVALHLLWVGCALAGGACLNIFGGREKKAKKLD
jgi:UDP:flavonoid glycosyltransferase YjiC (YdhE family)